MRVGVRRRRAPIRMVAVVGVLAAAGPMGLIAAAPPAMATPPTCVPNTGSTALVRGQSIYTAVGPRVARIDTSGPRPAETIVAGTGGPFSGDGGPAKAAGIRGVFDLSMDAFGNLYLVDNTRIRKVTPGPDGIVNGGAGEIITTVVGTGVNGFAGDGGAATLAQTRNARAVDFGASGNMYIADAFNNRVRRVVPGADGEITGAPDEIITTVAGTGTAGSGPDGGPAHLTDLNLPFHVDVLSAQQGPTTVDVLYLVEGGRLRKVTPGADNEINRSDDDVITTIATGLGSQTGLDHDAAGNFYVASSAGDNSAIRRVAPGGAVTLVAGIPGQSSAGYSGDGGPATAAKLFTPLDVTVDASNNLLIGDLGNNRIRKVTSGADGVVTGAADEIITTLAGNGNQAASVLSITCARLPFDYDGDLDDDIAVYRPSDGGWYVNGGAITQWGAADDVPVPGDYDGNGGTNVAVYRPSEGLWYVNGGGAGPGFVAQWGVAGDIPVPGDYDGNGTTDLAVYRPSEGVWYVNGGGTGPGIVAQWGAPGDIPVPGDYDGNRTTDLAVFRPSNSTWYVFGGATNQWGASGDIPVPGDYDGNGTTDLVVYRPAGGLWFVLGGTNSQWGVSGDVPVPADYDGDGDTDTAVYRPSTGFWFILGGTTNQWGIGGDVPLSLPYAIRHLSPS